MFKRYDTEFKELVNQVEQKLVQLRIQTNRESALPGIIESYDYSSVGLPSSTKQSLLTQTPPSVRESEILSAQE